MDFNALFGLTDTAEKKTAKGTAKKESKKTSTTKTFTARNDILLPVTVSVPLCGTIKLEEKDFNKKNITEKEVLSHVEKIYPAYTAGLTKVEKKDQNLIIYHKDIFSPKEEYVVSGEVSLYYMGTTIPLEEGNEEERTYTSEILRNCLKEELPDSFYEETPLLFAFDADNNRIIAKIGGGPDVKALPLPDKEIEFILDSGERRVIDASTLSKLIPDDAAVQDQIPINEAFFKAIFDNEIDVSKLKLYKEQKNHYFVGVDCISSGKEAENSGKAKEVTYPVQGTTINLLFHEYRLDSADFGGKTAISESDIKKFLVAQGHREFAFAKMNVQYSKKEKMILVTIQGSKKGGAPSCGHPLFTSSENAFHWNKEKIPFDVLLEGRMICSKAFSKLQAELLLELYYQSSTHRYFWYMPEQYVTTGSIEANMEPYLQAESLCGLVKVGQFHSHGIYKAFFSRTDERDEKVPGIYGVWGNFNENITTQNMYMDPNNFLLSYIDENQIRNIIDVEEVFALNGFVPLHMDSIEKNVKEFAGRAHDPSIGKAYMTLVTKEQKEYLMFCSIYDAELIASTRNAAIHEYDLQDMKAIKGAGEPTYYMVSRESIVPDIIEYETIDHGKDLFSYFY